jgi:hypothetical protein
LPCVFHFYLSSLILAKGIILFTLNNWGIITPPLNYWLIIKAGRNNSQNARSGQVLILLKTFPLQMRETLVNSRFSLLYLYSVPCAQRPHLRPELFRPLLIIPLKMANANGIFPFATVFVPLS